MVDLVLVQANRFHEIDVDLVGCGQTTDQITTASATMLRYRQDRRNVVSWMGIVRCQERVVIVELANGDTVGPGCPLR